MDLTKPSIKNKAINIRSTWHSEKIATFSKYKGMPSYGSLQELGLIIFNPKNKQNPWQKEMRTAKETSSIRIHNSYPLLYLAQDAITLMIKFQMWRRKERHIKTGLKSMGQSEKGIEREDWSSQIQVLMPPYPPHLAPFKRLR